MHTDVRTSVAVLLDELKSLTTGEVFDQVADLHERLTAGRLRVVFAGEAKRGKSTLINALIGEDLLPRGVLPLTSVTTEVETVPTGCDPGLVLDLADGSTTTTGLSDLARVQGSQGRPGVVGLRRLRVLVERPMPAPMMTLIDTPGLGSINAENDEEARAAYRRMDAVVLVLTADSPMTAADVKLLSDLTALAVRTYIVLNKADLLTPAEMDVSLAFVSSQSVRATGVSAPVLALTAARALEARLNDDETGWEASGVAELWRVLGAGDAASRVEALGRSVARDALYLTLAQRDEISLAAAAAQTEQRDVADRLAALGSATAEAERRWVEAAQVLDAVVRSESRVLLDTALQSQAAMTRDVRSALTEALARGVDDDSPRLMEERGLGILATEVDRMVRGWMRDQRASLHAMLHQQAERQQQLLDTDAARLRDVSQSTLGVRLEAPPVQLTDRAPTRTQLDLSTHASWNTDQAAWLRRVGPRAAARGRVVRHLNAVAADLVDRNIGRARVALFEEFRDAAEELRRSVRSAYTAQSQGLVCAQQILSCAEGSSSTRAELERRTRDLDRLRRIAEDFRALDDRGATT